MIRGVEHICQQSMASGCYLVNHGRPVLEWVPVSVARVTRELAAIRATQTSSSSSPSM